MVVVKVIIVIISKVLQGQYIKKIAGKTDNSKAWQWLREGKLMKETESQILAAEEQALKTNACKTRIEKTANRQQIPSLQS